MRSRLLKNGIILFMAVIIQSCNTELKISSPDGKNEIAFELNKDGVPSYMVTHNEKVVIGKSTLGFLLKKEGEFYRNFKVLKTSVVNKDESWQRVWGDTKSVRDNYTELKVELQERNKKKRLLNLYFRTYNDGVALRYEFPKQPNLKDFIIIKEKTEFALTGNHKCWWQPADWEIYEHLYTESKLSDIDCTPYINNGLAQSHIPDKFAVNTPVTMNTDNDLFISIHEANLTDYAGMTLHLDKSSNTFSSSLVSWQNGDKVRTSAPSFTPWRTIQISETAGGLLESDMIVNLNEPCKIKDTEWIKPAKYVGIWWEMHVGVSTWDKKSGRHGATTENTKRYIDFAAENGFNSVLVEGWNLGWEDWIGTNKKDIFDFDQPYSDFDIKEITDYGKSKGITLVGHHETSAAVESYERQLDDAFKFYEKYGVTAVKTGYVGILRPNRHYHHSQWMVNHYRKVLKKAAEHKIMIIAHEPIKATGIRRTYPNMMAREGLRGQEFNAWGNPGNNPEHTVIFPFTRMLGGPIDFTPGAFNIKLDGYNKPNNQVPTTIAKQLALYVTISSPVQMACDLPENYKKHMDAFQFIQDVPVDWQDSKILNAEIGKYLTTARKDKNSDNWFIGSITNSDARDLKVKLDFLDKGKKYKATFYKDAANAHWKKNPVSYEIETKSVDSDSVIDIKLAPGGGQAISIVAQ